MPQTLENTREKDETMVLPDDEEVAADEATDEFSGEKSTGASDSAEALSCAMRAGQLTFPKAQYYKRGGYQIKQIVKFAANRDYSDVVVINENRKKVRPRVSV
eukprot:scaffold349828_cov41-Prasinocladus_malaysianus.AAC.1